MASEGDQAEASARWPDFARLALVRAEEELPRWGRSTLEFRDASNHSAEPIFALDDKGEVTTRSTSRDSGSTQCNPCIWFRIPWHGACQRPSR
jgi:hypothetical protein